MKKRLLLGYDVGSSSIKASLLDAESGRTVASAQSPDQEMKIEAPHAGWAEQHPELWWRHVIAATKRLLRTAKLREPEIQAIGISYQMHGLVMLGKTHEVLSPAIIWCDSRAVDTGSRAAAALGEKFCLTHLLNTPGNFTASKLRWVKDNLPDVFRNVHRIMLPGDYVAFRMTGQACTTVSGLSEGILWDFSEGRVARELLKYHGIDESVLPEIVPTFGAQGVLGKKGAAELGLPPGIPVAYRAGDQPNNALSLNVLNAGDVAATAGTSGVVYGVTTENVADAKGRVNTFAHVNYSVRRPVNGVLLCINGTGIQYSWVKKQLGGNRRSYAEMNRMAGQVAIGAEGVLCFPFGNGAERVLENLDVGGGFSGINFNIHEERHLIRAAQEGIAFAFCYGLEVLNSMGIDVSIVRAGDSNLFQSGVFRDAFVNACNLNLEIYNTDGSQGAARGAGIGIGLYSDKEAFRGLKVVKKTAPDAGRVDQYGEIYRVWKKGLSELTQRKL